MGLGYTALVRFHAVEERNRERIQLHKMLPTAVLTVIMKTDLYKIKLVTLPVVQVCKMVRLPGVHRSSMVVFRLNGVAYN